MVFIYISFSDNASIQSADESAKQAIGAAASRALSEEFGSGAPVLRGKFAFMSRFRIINEQSNSDYPPFIILEEEI